jgi:hypothetical protein
MPIVDRDYQIKKWDPRILLHSGRWGLLGWIGVGKTQLTLGTVPNTSALDTGIAAFSNLKTKKIKVGYPGSVAAGLADFQWTSATNQTAQNIDLGSIIPGKASVMMVKIHTEATHTGAVSLALLAGNVSAGNQFLATGANFTADDIRQTAQATIFNVAPVAAASKVWLNGTPGANWSLMTAGIVAVYVTYLEI